MSIASMRYERLNLYNTKSISNANTKYKLNSGKDSEKGNRHHRRSNAR